MNSILKSIVCLTALFFLLPSFSFADSKYVDGWLGVWTVTKGDKAVVTWKLTDTWVSDTGMSHLAYGVASPGDVEFIIVYNGMFKAYLYVEKPRGTTIYDLEQDLSLYSQLVPASDFKTFTVKEGGFYPIHSGYKRKGSEMAKP